MKKIISFMVLSASCIGSMLFTKSNDVHARIYTNPKVLRAHNWYSTHTDAFGGEYYYKLHFSKHAVYEYNRKVGSRHWYYQRFVNETYFIRRANLKGAYTFGPQGVDSLFDVETVRPRYFTLANHKRYWGLEYFDHTNHHGGLDRKPPYRTWCYFTKRKYVTGDWGAWTNKLVY